MIISEIIRLFPTPIYTTKLNRKFSNIENKFVEKSRLDVDQNEGNVNTNNNYVLNESPFKKLKEDINLILKDYSDKIYCSGDDFNLKITQSWLNYTETNQYHHHHSHSNSVVSGVLYINADKDNDKIKFFKRDYQFIKPNYKSYNEFNSHSWWLPVETSQLILFPSNLIHCVEIKKGTNTRISLAFNTFVKGKLGNNKALEELVL